MTTLNAYDNQVYAYGQGPSKTTVTAPSVGVAISTPVTISRNSNRHICRLTARSSSSKLPQRSSMRIRCKHDLNGWNTFTSNNQNQPTITGVTVTLTAIDPNGNFVTLGTVTSDASGTYALTWTPPAIPGNYAITATFAGTGGYYGSTAEAHVYVGPASATPAPTAAPASGLATMSGLTIGIAVAVIAIIIAIAIVGLLLLRKKP